MPEYVAGRLDERERERVEEHVRRCPHCRNLLAKFHLGAFSVELVEPGDRPVVVTKGDANTKADPWTARLEGDVAWRHRLTIPYAGHALLFLRSPTVRMAFLYLAPAVLALIWLARIWGPGAPRGREIVA